MMLSVNPDLTPAQCKVILMATGRVVEFEGNSAPRTVNAALAVERAAAARQ